MAHSKRITKAQRKAIIRARKQVRDLKEHETQKQLVYVSRYGK